LIKIFYGKGKPSSMDLHQLQAFDQIVFHGSFSKAARQLDVSQPTISLRIRALEQEVGGALFLRKGSQLRLTELGQSFLPYAQTALREHYVHLGFVTGPFFHPEISSLLRLEEPLVMVTHPGHPLTQGEHFTLADVMRQSHPFFLIDWSWEVRHWQSQWLSSASSIIEVPPQTAYELVGSGMGVGLLTHAVAGQGLKKGELVEITVQDMPRLRRESLLVYRTADSPLPTAVNEWLRFFREEARQYCLA
jgi:DNA-binding transcriptional LysR family regulator